MRKIKSNLIIFEMSPGWAKEHLIERFIHYAIVPAIREQIKRSDVKVLDNPCGDVGKLMSLGLYLLTSAELAAIRKVFAQDEHPRVIFKRILDED